MDIEPRLKDFLSQEAYITEIITEDGQSVPIENEQKDSNSWDMSSVTANIRLPAINNLPKKIRKLKKMTIEVPFKFVLGTTEVKFDDVLNAKGVSQTVQDSKITVTDVKRGNRVLQVRLNLEGNTAASVFSQILNIILVNNQGKKVSEGWINSGAATNDMGILNAYFFDDQLNESVLKEPLNFSFSVPSDTIRRNIRFLFTDIVIP